MSWKFYSKAFEPQFVVLATIFIYAFFPVFSLGSLDDWGAFTSALFFLGALPFASVYLGVMRKRTDFNISSMQKRREYYHLWGVFFAAGAAFFAIEGAIGLFAFSLLMAEIAAVMYFVNAARKASLHVAAIAGAVTALFYAYGTAALPLLLLVPLVALVRLKLKAHTLEEVVLGAAIGFATAAVSFAVIVGSPAV